MRTLILISSVLLLGGGCTLQPLPGNAPNVYQPPLQAGRSEEECPFIEYRWQEGVGYGRHVIPRSGDFCAELPDEALKSLEARCVAPILVADPENPDPSAWKALSDWVPAVVAPSVEEFRKLCPLS